MALAAMSLVDFDYHLFGTRVRFGDGAACHLRTELDALGVSRPLLLSQDRTASSPRYAAIVATLDGLATLQRHGIPAHSSVSLMETMATEAAGFGADCLVAIGGGSVADSAKALAMLLAEGGHLADHVTVFRPPRAVEIPRRTRPKLPIIAIPTTASGAELTSSFGVRGDTHEKRMFWNRQVAATTVLVDPLMSEGVSMASLRYTAMNGIAHCLEGLYSRGRSIVSDGMAIQAIGLFQQALGTPALDERTQRRLILAAAHLAGMVLSMARSCLHHAICHVIGAQRDLPHGMVNTVVLPHALRFNEAATVELLAPALDMVNRQSHKRYAALSDWLQDLSLVWSLPRSLGALGVPEDSLRDMAGHILTERGLALNPRPVEDAGQVLAILRQAY